MRSVTQGCRTAGTWAWRHFRLVAGLALLAGVGLALLSEHAAIAAVDWAIDPWALAGAVGLMAVAPLLQALTLRIALRRLGAQAPAVATLRVWGRSFLMRYEPSGVVGFAYRVRERERLGATTPQVLTATGYEQLAAVTAGTIAAVAGFLIAGVDPPLAAVLLLAAVGGAAVALRPAWLGDRVARWSARRGIAVAGPLRGRTLALMVAIDLCGWAATAAGATLLAAGLFGAAAPGGFVLLGAFALSWTAGVLLPLLPAGLGPRDAVLAAGLAGLAGAGIAAALALALRVVSLASELVAVAIAEVAAAVLARRERATSLPRARLAGAPAARGTATDRTIVVVPTYDEREALPLFLERFAATGFDLLVVDDGSPDGTGDLADELAAQRPWMHVMHRAQKDGLGMAYRAGFGWCLAAGYGVIAQMDCDLSHPPEKLAEMRDVLLERDAGLVLGSRYAPGGGTDGWSRTRLALSRAGCGASRLALGLPYSDLSGGFKVWRADCLAAIAMDEMLSAGYAFQVETTQLAHLAGARIEEVAFVFSERVAGASKMTLRISLEGIRVTLALRRHHRRGRRPGLPVAL
ncbi:MAG: dolichol-phosphate mannosyltransferase [Solirubrobacteraceae bacterium]|jgi:dolichol-phosphate mannosyltransferase|nr:dolichol-phosphate mannosyltransferase [Solirubrobacteraceae bacterium]